MRIIVCESCEAEYRIQYNMNDRYYIVSYCTFCGAELIEENIEEMEWEEED